MYIPLLHTSSLILFIIYLLFIICHYSQQIQRRTNFSNCSRRGITEIPSNLPLDVEEIDFSYNNITFSHQGSVDVFMKYNAIRSVDFGYNLIHTFPNDVLLNATILEYIEMSGNHLFNLTKGVFNNLKYLKTIHGLTTNNLAPGGFENLTKLRELSIMIQMDEISEDLFEGLSLQKVSLKLPNIKTIPSNVFVSGNMSLREINIDAPKLEYLPKDIFKLNELEKVYISAENVTTLHNCIFNGVSLSSLNGVLPGVPESYFKYIETVTSYNYRLKEIYLEGIQSIPLKIFQNLPSLEKVTILKSRNIHMKLFKYCSRLNYLDLTGTANITFHKGWSFHLYSLKTLNLSNCNIAEIDFDTMEGLREITVLDLSKNNISFIKESHEERLPFPTSGLKELNLSYNELQSLPKHIFERFLSLNKLDISNNRILELPQTIFDKLNNLKRLDLSMNRLTYIPAGILDALYDCTFINMSNNAISDIAKDTFIRVTSLRRLDMSNNNITKVPDRFLAMHLMIDEVFLTNNPVNCDCSFVDLFWVRRMRSSVKLYGTCEQPAHLQNRTLGDITIFDMCPKSPVIARIPTTTLTTPLTSASEKAGSKSHVILASTTLYPTKPQSTSHSEKPTDSSVGEIYDTSSSNRVASDSKVNKGGDNSKQSTTAKIAKTINNISWVSITTGASAVTDENPESHGESTSAVDEDAYGSVVGENI